MTTWTEHLQDPRLIAHREAIGAIQRGERGAHERYRDTTGGYLVACAEYQAPEETSTKLRAIHMQTFINHGYPLGAVCVAFKATTEESDLLMAAPPTQPEPVDEIERLQRMPYAAYLQTEHWKRVRAEAIKRADGRCTLCARPFDLEVHHRDYSRVGCERPMDVIVLCAKCHRHHHEQEAA